MYILNLVADNSRLVIQTAFSKDEGFSFPSRKMLCLLHCVHSIYQRSYSLAMKPRLELWPPGDTRTCGYLTTIEGIQLAILGELDRLQNVHVECSLES